MISHKNWARQRNRQQKKKPGPRRSFREAWAQRRPFRVFWADFSTRFRENLRSRSFDMWDDMRNNFWSVYVLRSMKLSFRVTLWICFIAYVWMGATLSANWIETKWARVVPVNEAPQVAEKYLTPRNPKDADPEAFRVWLARRQPAEADQLIKSLEFYSPRMIGLTFVIYSNWMLQQHRLREALFWREFAMFRTRYDSVRCGAELATERISDLLHLVFSPELKNMIDSDPSLVPTMLGEVLKYDGEHPALDNPALFCKSLTGGDFGSEDLSNRVMIPEKDWFPQRMNLRVMTEFEIRNLKEQQGLVPPAPKQDVPEKQSGQKKTKATKPGPHRKKAAAPGQAAPADTQ